ncbi:MAG: phosphomannose isomerase type II C-terminal cupin domain [Gammaproteobacteria bacterium]
MLSEDPAAANPAHAPVPSDSQLPRQHETRPWGTWTVLNEGTDYRVRLIGVLPGHRLSLHYHYNRSEHWVVVAGKARIVIGQQRYDMHLMQSVLIPARTIHRIENPYSDMLQIVEVQRGDRLDEDDIVRLEDDYQRLHLAGGIRL